MTEINDYLKPNDAEKMDMLLWARCACTNLHYVWEAIYALRYSGPAYLRVVLKYLTIRTGWKYSTYSSPAMSVNEMGMETNVWHCALIENITVLALKELCCLLNIGISQHLMIKDATSENLYLIKWLLKKRTVQKIVTFLADKKHPHLWMLCLAWLLYLLCGLRGLIKKLRQYLLQQFRK